MKTKLILCLALVLSGGLFGCSAASSPDDANVNDGFQLETQINLVEKAASDSALPDTSWTNKAPCFVMDDALDELNRHYWLWATNTSIPPRLSRAVLTIFPSLKNSSVDPQLKGLMWCNAVRMLGNSHDPTMVYILRPYLKQKELADDPGGLNDGTTTTRICDDAAEAINSLLNLKLDFTDSTDLGMFLFGHEVFTNGTNVTIWQSHIVGSATDDKPWSGFDPAWKSWDKKIAKLEKQLDAMGFTNAPVNHSVAVLRVSPVITNVPAQTNLPTDLPWHGVVDPATGLPLRQ